MGIYLLVFVLCVLIGIVYVLLIRQLLKRSVKADIPSPFTFSKEFLLAWKKFGIVYLIGDLTRFAIEWFILGAGNAVVMRLVAIMITFSTSGFFGRRRSLVIRKIRKDVTKSRFFWEYLGDTFASLVFWVPMYVAQLMVLVAFNLTHWSSVWYSVYVSVGSILLFGRLGCFVADLLERCLFGKKA